jgi:hypothetical protein
MNINNIYLNLNKTISKENNMTDVYYIDSSQEWKKKDYILPSRYKKNGMRQEINKLLKKYPNNHIVCVGYSLGDVQLGISETMKNSENIIDALHRGLKEELNITLNNYNFFHKMYKQNNSIIHVITINVNNNVIIDYAVDTVECNNINDSESNDKVVIILHGRLNTLKRKINHFSSSENGLNSLHLIKLKMAKDIYNFL